VYFADVLSNIAQKGAIQNEDTASRLISKLHSLMFRMRFQVKHNIIRVFVNLARWCDLSWDLRRNTNTFITNTVKSWDVKQNIPLPARLISIFGLVCLHTYCGFILFYLLKVIIFFLVPTKI